MIVIIDYGLGNLLSVSKAFEEVARREKVCVSSDPRDLAQASHIVLPGVGNFKAGIRNLNALGMVEPLAHEVLVNRKLFLGICLGMHLLAERGEEFGNHAGLGWIPGHVRQLQAGENKLPHLGWQDIDVVRNNSLIDSTAVRKDYYFVHSYALDCPEDLVIAYCEYGERFPAAIQKDNIHAVQFHPEKSREAGLAILRNFVRGKECSKSEWFLSSF